MINNYIKYLNLIYYNLFKKNLVKFFLYFGEIFFK